jgi:hypothetical protein
MAASLSLPTAPVIKPVAAMPTKAAQKRTQHLGGGRLVRYLIGLGYVGAAGLALALVVNWTSPVAEPLAVDTDDAAQAFVAEPYVSSDPSLPSAASVFLGQPGEAAQQVDSF